MALKPNIGEKFYPHKRSPWVYYLHITSGHNSLAV